MQIRHTVLLAFALSSFSLVSAGCSSHRATLDEINPVRVYTAPVENIFEGVRSFCRKESFIVDRAEPETGSFFAHKVIGRGGFSGGYSGGGGDKRTVIMHLKAKRLGAGKTELTANISFGDGHISTTREDEEVLIDNYSMLFQTLDVEVK